MKNNRPVRLCTDLARFGVISQAFLKVLAAVYFGSAAKLADARTRENAVNVANRMNRISRISWKRSKRSGWGRDQGTRFWRRRLEQRLWAVAAVSGCRERTWRSWVLGEVRTRRRLGNHLRVAVIARKTARGTDESQNQWKLHNLYVVKCLVVLA